MSGGPAEAEQYRPWWVTFVVNGKPTDDELRAETFDEACDMVGEFSDLTWFAETLGWTWHVLLSSRRGEWMLVVDSNDPDDPGHPWWLRRPDEAARTG